MSSTISLISVARGTPTEIAEAILEFRLSGDLQENVRFSYVQGDCWFWSLAHNGPHHALQVVFDLSLPEIFGFIEDVDATQVIKPDWVDVLIMVQDFSSRLLHDHPVWVGELGPILASVARVCEWVIDQPDKEKFMLSWGD